MKLKDLILVEPAQTVARELVAEFPETVFTDGRRTLAQQANRMANNIAKNRFWIKETYVLSVVANECQAWVDANPGADIEAGLLRILQTFDDHALCHLSRHLTGEAFDVAKPSADAQSWLAAKAQELHGKFLTHEGGLEIFHFQA